MSKWTDEVRQIVLTLPEKFTTQDVYLHESKLAAAHPENQNVRAKIRQQLQVMRDKNLIKHGDKPGQWERTEEWKKVLA